MPLRAVTCFFWELLASASARARGFPTPQRATRSREWALVQRGKKDLEASGGQRWDGAQMTPVALKAAKAPSCLYLENSRVLHLCPGKAVSTLAYDSLPSCPLS